MLQYKPAKKINQNVSKDDEIRHVQHHLSHVVRIDLCEDNKGEDYGGL